MKCTDHIPIEKFGIFHSILCKTGGRYVSNPVESFGTMIVEYEPGDYKVQCLEWKTMTMPIREARRDQWWRVLLRRLGVKKA